MPKGLQEVKTRGSSIVGIYNAIETFDQ